MARGKRSRAGPVRIPDAGRERGTTVGTGGTSHGGRGTIQKVTALALSSWVVTGGLRAILLQPRATRFGWRRQRVVASRPGASTRALTLGLSNGRDETRGRSARARRWRRPSPVDTSGSSPRPFRPRIVGGVKTVIGLPLALHRTLPQALEQRKPGRDDRAQAPDALRIAVVSLGATEAGPGRGVGKRRRQISCRGVSEKKPRGNQWCYEGSGEKNESECPPSAGRQRDHATAGFSLTGCRKMRAVQLQPPSAASRRSSCAQQPRARCFADTSKGHTAYGPRSTEKNIPEPRNDEARLMRVRRRSRLEKLKWTICSYECVIICFRFHTRRLLLVALLLETVLTAQLDSLTVLTVDACRRCR